MQPTAAKDMIESLHADIARSKAWIDADQKSLRLNNNASGKEIKTKHIFSIDFR